MKKTHILIKIILIIIALLACESELGLVSDDDLFPPLPTPRFAVGLVEDENTNFILRILNTGDISTIDIKVYIDGELKIDADFENENSGMTYIPPQRSVYLQLNKGMHTIKAISITGKAVLEQEFEVVDKHWAILGYDYFQETKNEIPPQHFGFIIQTDPIHLQ